MHNIGRIKKLEKSSCEADLLFYVFRARILIAHGGMSFNVWGSRIILVMY